LGLGSVANGVLLRQSRKQPVKQPEKRKRQQSVDQADKPITDADKAVEAAQQLVAFKKLAVARQKAAKAVPMPAPTPMPTTPAPAPMSSPNRPPPSAQPPRLEPEDLISSVPEIPEPALPSPPALRRAIDWSDPLLRLARHHRWAVLLGASQGRYTGTGEHCCEVLQD